MKPRVALFVTCLVDLLRPSVGFAAVRLLEAAGCEVVVPRGQTCCGQPAYNAGDTATARDLARQSTAACGEADYVVVPSGSCAAHLKRHVPRLFDEASPIAAEAHAFAGRVHELLSFLADVRRVASVPGAFRGRVAYHDGCSGLRELGIAAAPRRLLATMDGVEIVETAERETCCGFGGLFSVSYPEISNAMVTKKCAALTTADPDLVLAGDLGCLMNIAGKLARDSCRTGCRHVAEVLAGDLAAPPIGKPA